MQQGFQAVAAGCAAAAVEDGGDGDVAELAA